MLQWILKTYTLDTNHTCLLLKGRIGLHVKTVVFSRPTGVGWGIMYRACHIVSLPQVLTAALSFKYPTCEMAGTNKLL